MALEEFGKNVENRLLIKKSKFNRGAVCAETPCPPATDREEELFKNTKTQWALCGTEEYTGIQKTQKTLHPGVYRSKFRQGELVVSYQCKRR